MARLLNIVFSLLLVLPAQLVNCGNIRLGQVFGCKEKVWGPNFLHVRTSSVFPYQSLFYGFPTQQECQATMCASRCSKYSTPINQSPTEPSSLLAPNERRATGPPQEVIPVGDKRQVEELKAILGPNTQIILDKGGHVIGMEAPSSKNSETNSPYIPQGGNRENMGDDGSICCSTREVFYFNNTLVDYYGRTQVIAQVNEVGVYQLIRHGLCGNTGACTGECDQIYVTIPLVVHPTRAGQQVSFSLFKVPGYCTCRVRSTLGAFRRNLA